MSRIRFLKDAVGRSVGTVEHQSDETLCQAWAAAGFVEIEEGPPVVEDRDMDGPVRDRAIKGKGK